MEDKDFIKKKAKMIYPFVNYGKLNSEDIISRDYESVENLRSLEKTVTKDMVASAKMGNTVELLKLSIIYKNVFGRS